MGMEPKRIGDLSMKHITQYAILLMIMIVSVGCTKEKENSDNGTPTEVSAEVSANETSVEVSTDDSHEENITEVSTTDYDENASIIPSARRGISRVNSPEGLSLRKNAASDAERITIIPDKQRVTVLDVDANAVTIDGINNFWYLVEYDYMTGWVFGGYLTSISPFGFDETTGTITHYVGDSLDIIIPEQIDGIAVTAIGEHAFSNHGITSLVIPEGVISIGEYAFRKSKLSSVVIPHSVTSLGEKAFEDSQLTEVVIGNGLIVIEDDVQRRVVEFLRHVEHIEQLSSEFLLACRLKTRPFRSGNTITPIVKPNGWPIFGNRHVYYAVIQSRATEERLPLTHPNIGSRADTDIQRMRHGLIHC
jgi:hypothetical protein